MPRILSDRDIRLLSLMAPEYTGELCNGSGKQYRSLLPPVANHYSVDSEDFKQRISKLNSEDLQYLMELIMTGEESLHCIPPDYFLAFELIIRDKMGETAAKQVAGAYAMSCD